MSVSYSIAIKLDAAYKKENIVTILEAGGRKGLIYYDHTPGQGDGNPPIINAAGAAAKVIKALEDNLDTGPAVYVSAKDESKFSLWFYKNEDGTLDVDMGGFGNAKKKGLYIDFAYYLRMFLDLVEDFSIVEVKTETY